MQRFRDFIWKNARKGRLLDIGCGPLELPGYLNLDGKKGFDFFGLDPIDNQKIVGVRIVGCAELQQVWTTYARLKGQSGR